MSNPDQLESDIGQTRESLRKDMNRLNDRVSPQRLVSSRRERIKNTADSVKGRLMGSADDPGQAASDKMGSAAASAKNATNSAAGKLSDAAGSAPQAIRENTQGNPVAAGLIAFGAGWLLSSLLPASQAEKDAAQQVEENAGVVVDPLKESAKEAASNLQQPLQDSADSLKRTATDAADRTTDHAKSAASDVKGQAEDARDDVADSR